MSSSSSSSPRFLTLVIVPATTDEFGQRKYYNMQIVTATNATNGRRNGSVFFGDWTSGIPNDSGVWNPYAKFEVEAAGIGGMVHLKSSYNQKYLRRASEDQNDPDIAAVADEPEEDISKWSCTLFRFNSNRSLEIQYNGRMWPLRAEEVRSLNNAVLLRVNDGMPRPEPPASFGNQFEQYDLDALPTLPDQICLKADNSRYLQVIRPATGTNQVIRAMFTGNDRRQREAQFRVVRTRLRTVVLVPVAFPDTYLVRTSNGYVASASSNQTNRRNALLHPVTLNFAGPAAVAFRSVPHPNRHFMVRRGSDNAFAESDIDSGLVAQAEFLIEDTVLGRNLSNIQFLYDNMKILDPTPVAVLTKNVVNGSTVSTQEAHLAFKYSEYQSNHWETTHSWQVGVSVGTTTTISARLPVLKFIKAEATVSVGVEAGYQGEHIVGETKEVESEMSTSLTVNVPPKTQSFVHMTVSRAKIRLPYTYTQREVRHDGSSVANNKVDGLYEGEATHVDYQVEESIL
ncbi:hypothetical protein LINGRAHAP2_LOCUS28180 [Linum grandiflorum]